MGRSVMVVSLPRSGSSWVGEILGAAPGVSYRREPITRAVLAAGGDPFSAVDTASAGRDLLEVVAAAFATGAVERIVVKEVAPLRIALIRSVADPVTVLLVRHPGAVAASHLRLGWRPRKDLVDRFGPGDADLKARLDSLWNGIDDFSRLVAYAAAVLTSARRILDAPEDMVVTYESLATDPVAGFGALYTHLGLDGAERLPLLLRSGDPDDVSPYATRRSAAFDPYRWHDEIDQMARDTAASLWCTFGLPWYPPATW